MVSCGEKDCKEKYKTEYERVTHVVDKHGNLDPKLTKFEMNLDSVVDVPED